MGRRERRRKDRAEPIRPEPAAAPLPERRSWRRILLPAALLVAVTAVVYAPVWNAEFVNYDDYHYVIENSRVATGLRPRNVAWAFTAFAAGNWHPVTWISHQIDCQLYGLEPRGHHVSNVLLHAANAVLVLCILFAWTGAAWPSALVAGLFAVHPLNVESVAWVSERKNVLSTFFWLATMGAYFRYARQPSPLRYAAVALCLALGLMAKPMVVTLPFVLLLLDWWPLGRWSPEMPDAARRAFALLREKLPLFALVVVASLLTLAAQKDAGAVTTLGEVTLAHRLTNAVVSYVAYLGRMVWPTHLSVFYPHLGAHLPAAAVLSSALALAGLSALAWRLRRAACVPVGWLWYLGTLVPVIGIVQVGSQARADRYAYVPLLGIFVALAWGLDRLARGRRSFSAALAATAAVAVATLAVAAQRQAAHWQNSIALFEHANRITTGNYVAFTNLGLAYNKQNRWDEAIRHFDQALQIRPGSAEAWEHRGLALARQGRIDDAIRSLERALAIYPKSVHAHNNLGIALRKRDPEAAIAHLRQAIELDPEFAEARINLGAALLQKGEPAAARQVFDAALALEPDSAVMQFRLGSVLLDRGDLDEAASCFQAALRLDPTRVDAHNSLGVVRLRKGDLDGALPGFREALRIEPDHADAHSNIGVVLMRKGRTDEARAELATAIRLNPRHADAHATLGALLAQGGHLPEAIEHFKAAVDTDPDHAVAQNNLGAALLKQGELENALAHLTRAVSVNPAHADAQSNLGIALLQQGRHDEAIERLETALRLAPGHKNAQTYLGLARAQKAVRPTS